MADLLDDKLWQDAVALVPVPLDRAKAKQRGYNQAEIIARGISSRTGIPILRVIEAAGGEDQISLSAAGRTRNAAERFRLTADAVLMGKYIIVDDVLTTGSTASACAALLYQIGATDVRVATAAATYAGRNDQLTRRIEG
jgi:ComF family protein